MNWILKAWRFIAPVAKFAPMWYMIGGGAILTLGYSGYRHVIAHGALQSQLTQTNADLTTANETIVKEREAHEQEKARLALDRDNANKLRLQYRKDAQIENSKLKKLLADNEDYRLLYESLLPDELRRVRYERGTSKDYDHNQSDSQSATGGSEP